MIATETTTGKLKIGFRRGGGDWQRDPAKLASWAVEHGFSLIDLERTSAANDLTLLSAAGLQAGSVDLCDWAGYQGLIGPDGDRRQDIVNQTVAHIEACARQGARNFFAVTIPGDGTLPRAQNFRYFIESFGLLVPVLTATNTRIVIEGWPGPGAVCCTPETFRALFRELPPERVGINYDPSHLIRMGIDPIRFLKEFAAQVYHIHAKDTAKYTDDLYEFGYEQAPTFAKSHSWGGGVWRYTLPGHGETSWVEVLRLLKASGYSGGICVELEDENFNGSEEGEKRGLLLSRDFLCGC